jgi:hypothetical protein
VRRKNLWKSPSGLLEDQLAEAIDDLHADLSTIAFDVFANDRLHRVDMGADDGEIPGAYSVACFHELDQQIADRGNQVIPKPAALPL